MLQSVETIFIKLSQYYSVEDISTKTSVRYDLPSANLGSRKFSLEISSPLYYYEIRTFNIIRTSSEVR